MRYSNVQYNIIIACICNNVCFKAEKYMSEWLIYQSLWDLQADNLYSQMGDDINTWMTYLNDIQ